MSGSAPFDYRQVVARLEAKVAGLQETGGAADLARVADLRSFRPPSAFVVLAEETGDGKPTGHPTQRGRQMATARFGVTLAVRNHRYDRGAAAADDLIPLLGAVRDALIGWTPDLPGARACRFVEGRVLDYDAGVLLWSDLFETQHAIGKRA